MRYRLQNQDTLTTPSMSAIYSTHTHTQHRHIRNTHTYATHTCAHAYTHSHAHTHTHTHTHTLTCRVAELKRAGQTLKLGHFDNALDAARAYDSAALKYQVCQLLYFWQKYISSVYLFFFVYRSFFESRCSARVRQCWSQISGMPTHFFLKNYFSSVVSFLYADVLLTSRSSPSCTTELLSNVRYAKCVFFFLVEMRLSRQSLFVYSVLWMSLFL